MCCLWWRLNMEENVASAPVASQSSTGRRWFCFPRVYGSNLFPYVNYRCPFQDLVGTSGNKVVAKFSLADLTAQINTNPPKRSKMSHLKSLGFRAESHSVWASLFSMCFNRCWEGSVFSRVDVHYHRSQDHLLKLSRGDLALNSFLFGHKKGGEQWWPGGTGILLSCCWSGYNCPVGGSCGNTQLDGLTWIFSLCWHKNWKLWLYRLIWKLMFLDKLERTAFKSGSS